MDDFRYSIYKRVMPLIMALQLFLAVVNFESDLRSRYLYILSFSIGIISFVIIQDKYLKYLASFVSQYLIVIMSIFNKNPSTDAIAILSITSMLPVFLLSVLIGYKNSKYINFINIFIFISWIYLRHGDINTGFAYCFVMLIFSALFLYILKSFEDILLRFEEKVKEKTEDINKSNKDLKLFVDKISHETRTPLTSVFSILNKYKDSEDIKKVLKSLEKILDIINDTMDVSKMEQTSNLCRRSVDIHDLVQDSIDIVLDSCNEKNLYIRNECETIHMNIDKARFSQVLLNLLTNAIKFTFEGGIIVRAYQESSREILEVIDTGLGIPEEFREKIFEAFEQVPHEIPWNDNLTEGENIARIPSKGTGLGLNIIRRIVEQHAGRVWVEEMEKGGSKFIIALPRE